MGLFFVGLNPRWQQFSWLPENINVMYSAGGCWDKDARRWRRKRFFNKGLKFLDCGGFTMLNKYGDYPFTADNLLNLVAFLRPDYYATMDYPCEPDISRKLQHSSNRERILATVEYTKWFKDNHGLVGCSQAVPVIQGYSLDEYKFCIDQHHQAGTIAPYMAVGSMCRRLSAKELHVLIPGIYEHARQAGAERLHFFGLKLSPALRDLGECIYSRDSAVALYGYELNWNGRRWPKGMTEKRQAFEHFFSKLEQLGLDYHG